MYLKWKSTFHDYYFAKYLVLNIIRVWALWAEYFGWLACVEQAKEQLIELCTKVKKSSTILKGIGRKHFSLC